jgi:hypothetical protein
MSGERRDGVIEMPLGHAPGDIAIADEYQR